MNQNLSSNNYLRLNKTFGESWEQQKRHMHIRGKICKINNKKYTEMLSGFSVNILWGHLLKPFTLINLANVNKIDVLI